MKWLRRAAAVVAFAALVAGCTQPAPPRPTTPPSVAASAPADENSARRERLADGGILRLPLTALPTAWNPHVAAGRTPDAAAIRGPLSAPAFWFDAAGRPSANPDYLTGVDVSHNGRTVATLHLNERAVWSDGSPITAADWIATFKALTQPGFQAADAAGWSGVAEVAAGASDHEVVVTYTSVQPDWVQPLAAGAARAASVADPATFNAGWPSYQQGWFSGPFVVAHVDATQGVVTLDRNPLWWGDAPKLTHITFRTIQPEAVTAAFGHNEFDLLSVGTDADKLQRLRGIADTSIRTAPGTSGRIITFDTRGVLADPALRVALVRALDRGRLAATDIGALVDKPLVWGSHLELTNQPGYVDQAIATGLGFDQAAASDALTKAGWTLVDGRRVKDGRALALTMAVPADDPWARGEFAAASATLAEVGITLAAASGTADLTASTVTFGRFPLAAVAARADAALGDLPARIASETDAVRRADLAAQLDRQLWLSATAVPVFQVPQVVATRSGLANLGASGFGSVHWQDVGFLR